MNPYSVPPLVSALLFALLGFLVYKQNPQSLVNRGYLYWTLSTSMWQGSWTILFNTTDPKIADFIVRFGYSIIIFLPVALYHFKVNFLNLAYRERTQIKIHYLIGVLFLLPLWLSNSFINGFYNYSWGYYPRARLPLHPIYLIWLSYVVLHAEWLVYLQIKKGTEPPLRQYQMKYVLLAGVTYLVAATDFLVNYGAPFYPLGVIFIIVSQGLIAYAILRYRLMDLRLLFQETSRYLLTAGLFSFIFSFIIYLATRSLKVGLMSFAGSLMLPYFQRRLNHWISTEKSRRGLIDSKQAQDVQSLSDRIKESGYKISDLAETVTSIIIDEFPASMCTMLVADHDQRHFVIEGHIGLKNKFIQPISSSDPLIKNLENNNKRVLVKAEAERFLNQDEYQMIANTFLTLEAEVCAPLVVLNRLAGILVLSSKKDNRPYFINEINRISSIAAETATALRYALAVSKAAAETKRWAHSLNQSLKPLTQAFEFLQMDDPITATKEERTEIFDVIWRSMKKLGGFLHYLTHQSRIIDEELRNNYERLPVDIREVLMKSLSTQKLSIANKNLELLTTISSDEFSILGHQRDLIAVVEALLSNAIRYVPAKGKIEITAKPHNNFLLIEISNTGPSIPSNHIEDIFTEGFQIKDGLEGTGGLGLANARRVIGMHKGKIWAENFPDNKGVKFIIEIPTTKTPDLVNV